VFKCCYSPRSVNHSSHSGLPKRRRTCLLGEQLQPGARIRLGFRDRATWSGEIVRSTCQCYSQLCERCYLSLPKAYHDHRSSVRWDVVVVWYSSREALHYTCSHKRGSVRILYCLQHMSLSVHSVNIPSGIDLRPIHVQKYSATSASVANVPSPVVPPLTSPPPNESHVLARRLGTIQTWNTWTKKEDPVNQGTIQFHQSISTFWLVENQQTKMAPHLHLHTPR